MRLPRLISLLCLLLAAGAVGLSRADAGEAQGVSALRDRASAQRAKEQDLAAGARRLGALVERTQRQVDAIERRRASVEADLAGDEARLRDVRSQLRVRRARLARLRVRLSETRGALRSRLVTLYQEPSHDLVSVVLTSRSLADVMARVTYLKRVRNQDTRIVTLVRSARADARSETLQSKRAEARVQDVVTGMRARRDAVAAMGRAAAARRATLAEARATRVAALHATRASRVSVERRIASIEAAEARRTREAAAAAAAAAAARARTARAPSSNAGGSSTGSGSDPGGATSSPGPSGPWSIPKEIVECESGGQNLPPNGAGASGYYQIIPGTWRQHGGSGSAAWKASKGEQDRVAAEIWAGGAGRSQWDCSAMV